MGSNGDTAIFSAISFPNLAVSTTFHRVIPPPNIFPISVGCEIGGFLLKFIAESRKNSIAKSRVELHLEINRHLKSLRIWEHYKMKIMGTWKVNKLSNRFLLKCEKLCILDHEMWKLWTWVKHEMYTKTEQKTDIGCENKSSSNPSNKKYGKLNKNTHSM